MGNRRGYIWCKARSQRVCIEACWYYTHVGIHPYCRDNCPNTEWEDQVGEGPGKVRKIVCRECGWEQVPVVSKNCAVCGRPWKEDTWEKEK